jgi:Putative peptidoglycan binding domain
MNSTTANSQTRSFMKSIKSSVLGLAGFAVLLTGMSYAKPADAAPRYRQYYVSTNGGCLKVRTSPSMYAPVVGCVSNGARLAPVVRFQNGFAKLSTGRFVSANLISTRRPYDGTGGFVILRVGSRGAAVAELQSALGLPVTGYFGFNTRSAVEDFQEANGLIVNGIVDIPTARALGFY